MITILNRKTLHTMQIRDMLEFDRLGPLRSDWVLAPDLSEVNGVSKKYWKLTGDVVSEMSQPEKDAVDAAEFYEHKLLKYEAIDAKTSALIAQGFQFPTDGYMYSLSLESQANIHGVFTARNLGVNYPIHWLNIDEQGSVDLENANDVTEFFLTALGTIRAHKDSGTVLKDLVTAATTVEQLYAIVDDR